MHKINGCSNSGKTELFPLLKAHYFSPKITSVAQDNIPKAQFHQSALPCKAEMGHPHGSTPSGTPFTWKNYFRTVRAEAKYSLPALILYGIFSGYLANREEEAQEKKEPATAPISADKKV